MRPGQLKLIELMRYYADQGRTLRSILPLIGKGWKTAMKYARLGGVSFPDHRRRRRKDG